MELSPMERLFLWNQLEILKHLQPNRVKDYEEHQKILENGYKIFYGETARQISESEVPIEVCTEVMQILDMYRAIGDSGGGKNADPASKFFGFDGNEETAHYGFASFLMDDQGKWAESAKRPRNSHHPTLDKYRRMVTTWKRLGRGYQLTADQVNEIVKS